ncbi:DUF6146 family protein [Flavobacteriaceae bacterium MHTCC 0001]
MKHLFYIILTGIFIFSCNTSKRTTQNKTKDTSVLAANQNDTIRIANEELEYEVIIIDIGFFNWFNSFARPRGFYSQQFMQTRNILFVNEWNQRVLQPQRFNPQLYELQIDYNPNIDYGYEVNYMLYNYFLYFQLTYKQRLGPFIPRI